MKRGRVRPLVVSFSGLDGSGKSTQIAALQQAVAQLGLSSRVITFWDDVVVASRWRESFVHKVYKSERGIGTPERPVQRRDKNIRAGYLTLMRHLLYFADAVHLRVVIHRLRQGPEQVVIVDRYIYDELANLPLKHRLSRRFARLISWIAPTPELAVLLDADPEMAVARKPEYPLAFVRSSRRSYLYLARHLGNIMVVPPLSLEGARGVILCGFMHALQQQGRPVTGAVRVA